MNRTMLVGLVLAVALLPMLGGCSAVDAMMNRDKQQTLQEDSENKRDADIARDTPPSISQDGGAAGGEGPQIIAMGDDVVENMSATVRYLKSSEEERKTDLKLKDIRKLNLFGYAIASVIIVALSVYVWRKTRKFRKAAKVALDPFSTRIKALVALKAEETDKERIAAINAKIADYNGLKADSEKKMNGAA